MPKVKMYADIEGDNAIGDIVEVSDERAQFLVVRGYATYANKSDAKVHPPVGGARMEGTQAGVEPTKKQSETLLTPPNERDSEIKVKTARDLVKDEEPQTTKSDSEDGARTAR